MDNIAIKVEDVSKVYKLYNKPSERLVDALGIAKKNRFKEHRALDRVSFEVKKGETIGIIGTNGSGKSTILKIITGVLSQTSGNVEISGRISALLELGAGFNMEYTGIENVYLNGMMMGFTNEEMDERLPEILKFADIGDFVNQPCKTYSSGMFVRLAFAVAINIDPEILIVDEALSVGDAFFQAKCYKKFDDFKAQGKTIIFVSHDISSVAKYCDRVILLNKGVKLSEGKPKETIDLYKKVLLNQDQNITSGQVLAEKKEAADTHLWKNNYELNPDVNEYGTGEAEIIDFAVVDEYGSYTNCIQKGTSFEIKSKVKFHTDIMDPIFTYTFKTVQGTAVTGTNTMYEKVGVGLAKAGETYVATFKQNMDMQGGEYLLSISCTGYVGGEFRAYHRLYDVVGVTVISDKNTVGFYDMNSETTVERVEE
ncbi:MAG: ABC transporter ATP-binding protein [Clostridiales bacterium]|nr:ABC transporter ATP-binding protein [Roseburia sp.]MDD7637924.1 ABC transporter ATP-binding protein [Clostridiales bacterium]MDY4113755.1 ABC transporter ATP-binding protein [Roseburia sp.]